VPTRGPLTRIQVDDLEPSIVRAIARARRSPASSRGRMCGSASAPGQASFLLFLG
jgi:hypothetical protein